MQEIAATARDDDDIHFGVRIECLDCRNDFGHGVVALHTRVNRAELDCWPAKLRVAANILLSIGITARDEADLLWQER